MFFEAIGNFWKRHHKINVVVLKFSLLAILCYNLYSKFANKDFGLMIQMFENQFSWSKIHFLFFVIALTFFNWGFESMKFYLCVQRLEKISFFKSYKGILFGNAMNLILPMSIGELTGRPMVLKEENRTEGYGIAYYVSIVQKVASPFVGLLFLLTSYLMSIIPNEEITILGWAMPLIGFICIISAVDLAFWFTMFWKPEWTLHLLEKIKSLKKTFESIENILHYSQKLKRELLLIGAARFLIFVTQYWLLMFLFFENFPELEFYILCGVYFLAQFVIPSLGFLDVGIRANLVAFIFSSHTDNFLQLMAVNYLIWMINVLVPSIFGFYLMRKSIVSLPKE